MISFSSRRKRKSYEDFLEEDSLRIFESAIFEYALTRGESE